MIRLNAYSWSIRRGCAAARTCFYHLHALQPRHSHFTRRRHETDQSPIPKCVQSDQYPDIEQELYAMPHASAIYDRELCQLSSSSGNRRSVLGRDAAQAIFGRVFPGLSRCPKVSELEGAFASVCSAETEINMYASFLSTVIAMPH